MKERKNFSLKKLKPKTLDKPPHDTSRFDDYIPKNHPLISDSYCKNCDDLKEKMKNLSQLHKKETQNLSFLLSYKDLALKKRDEMLYEYNQENLELRAKIKTLETLLSKKNANNQVFDPESLDQIGDIDKMNVSSPRRGSQIPLNNIKLLSQSSFSPSTNREILFF